MDVNKEYREHRETLPPTEAWFATAKQHPWRVVWVTPRWPTKTYKNCLFALVSAPPVFLLAVVYLLGAPIVWLLGGVFAPVYVRYVERRYRRKLREPGPQVLQDEE